MVVTYSGQGDTFRADKLRLWSEGQFTDRGFRNRNFDLHPDGERFSVLKTPQVQSEAKAGKVVLVLNFFDELRRLAPPKRWHGAVRSRLPVESSRPMNWLIRRMRR